MTSNKFNKLPQTYEQYIIPTVEQIRDEQAQLPAELIRELKNPNARFNQEIIVYPASSSNNRKGKGKASASSKSGIKLGEQQHLIDTFNNKGGCDDYEWWDGEDSAHQFDNGIEAHKLTTFGGASVGAGGAIVKGGIDYSLIRAGDSSNGYNFLGGKLGGEAGIGAGGVTASYTAKLDLASTQGAGMQARVGLDGSSGFTVGPGGVETKVGGFGVSVGKKMGISCPIAEISVDIEELGENIKDNCVIQ